MDKSMYAQPSQAQSQFNSPLYMQHIYPQQQYPVYGIVPPTWTQSPTPYFETPLVRHAVTSEMQSNQTLHEATLSCMFQSITDYHFTFAKTFVFS